MSVRRIPVFTLAVLLTLVGWGLSAGVKGAGDPAVPSPAPPEELRAKIDIPSAGGTETLTAALAFRSVVLTTHFGPVTLDLSQVKQLRVESVTDNSARAVVELRDGHELRGTIPTAPLTISADGQSQALTPAEGLKFKLLRPGDFSLWAALLGLLTLTLMEIVLGIDNIIFLAIVSSKLPVAQQPQARRLGLGAALLTRLLLLFSITWLLGLTKPLFTLPDLPFFHDLDARGISWRDLILLVGGAFLIGKSVLELHEKAEKSESVAAGKAQKAASFAGVIVQIAVIDIVFSLDSVITAVGMVDELWVMVTAVILAIVIMMIFAEPISRFVERNPTIKVLALSFLILIGVLLVADALGQHMNKGYIYFAMAFAVAIEVVNMRVRKRTPA